MQKIIPNRKVIFLTLPILTAVAVILLSVYAVNSTVNAGDSEAVPVIGSSKANPVEPPLAMQEPRDLTALVFAVRATGFNPDELTVSAGRYLIVVQNRTRMRNLTFRFERENGERLHEVRQEGLNWKRQFDLQPGNYVLSEVEHPEWRCVVHVTSR